MIWRRLAIISGLEEKPIENEQETSDTISPLLMQQEDCNPESRQRRLSTRVSVIKQKFPHILPQQSLIRRDTMNRKSVLDSVDKLQRDDQGRFLVLGKQVERLIDRCSNLEQDMSIVNETIDNLEVNIENDMNRRDGTINDSLRSIELRSSAAKEALNSRIDALSESSGEFKNVVTRQINIYDQDILDLSNRLKNCEEFGRNLEAKLDRTLRLQGELMSRMEKLESSQLETIKLSQETNGSLNILRESFEGIQKEAETFRKHTKDNLNYFDTEINELKLVEARNKESISEIEVRSDEQEQLLHTLSNNASSKLQYLEQMLRANAPDPPSPGDIISLCINYEENVVRSQFQGSSSTEVPQHIALKLANLSQRLASKIASSADLDILNSIVRGPVQPATKLQNDINAIETSLHCNDDFALHNRDALIAAFKQELNDGLQKDVHDLSSIRKNVDYYYFTSLLKNKKMLFLKFIFLFRREKYSQRNSFLP
jgi:hypothetical protein